MKVTFDAGHVTSGEDIEAERARLARYLGLARSLFLLAVIGALVIAYFSAVTAVPIIATQRFGQDGQEWPNLSVNFLELCEIGVLYIVIFGLMATVLLLAVHRVTHTAFFDPYWNLAVLEYPEKEEVLRLAEQWPAIESYRVAIALKRDFVRGDLDLMRAIAEKSAEAAYQEKVNQRIHLADHRLRQVPLSAEATNALHNSGSTEPK